ncbi:hypothetical protein V6N13_004959 [Hibiscus sabdariffa]
MVTEMALALEYSNGELSFKYLGMHIGVTLRSHIVWDSLLPKFQVRLVDWKHTALSFSARVLLVNSVISTLPTYYMVVFPIPKEVILKIDQIQLSFLWSEKDVRRQMSRVG